MKAVSRLALAAFVVASLAPAALASGRKPGSCLYYPLVVDRPNRGLLTLVSVTNTAVEPKTTQDTLGASTGVHFEFVNATTFVDFPFPTVQNYVPDICQITNVFRNLTAADTLTIRSSCVNPPSLNLQQIGPVTDVVQRGYLMVSANDTDAGDVEAHWKWDHLIGSELVISFADGYAYWLLAVPFLAGPQLAQEARTDIDGDFNNDFNATVPAPGVAGEYEKISDWHYADSVISIFDPGLTLANLTGGLNARNSVHIDGWNDNEVAFSANFIMGCWMEDHLRFIHPWFDIVFTITNEIGDNPSEIDILCQGTGAPSTPIGNIFESLWFRVDSQGVNASGGGFIASDGALLGAITAGPNPQLAVVGGIANFASGKNLWESNALQDGIPPNALGEFIGP
jgi:hypothetical protein